MSRLYLEQYLVFPAAPDPDRPNRHENKGSEHIFIFTYFNLFPLRRVVLLNQKLQGTAEVLLHASEKKGAVLTRGVKYTVNKHHYRKGPSLSLTTPR